MVPALVLAAGLGTRLDPLTRLVAKPAVPLGEWSLIERVLRYLAREDVRDIVINLHHRPESITAIVGDGSQFGLRVRYSFEREIMGSAGGPRRALPFLDSDTFLLVNGDTLCEIPLDPMIEAHEHSSADVTLAVVPNPAPLHYNGLRASEDRIVRRFVPRGAAADGTWHFVGLQVVEAAAFRSLPDGVPAESIAGLYRGFVAAEPGRVCIYPVTASFTDVGTPHDYFAAALTFRTGLSIPEAPDCVVWPGVRIAPDARLRGCIVAADVPAGLSAVDAVLIPADRLRPGDRATMHGPIGVFSFDTLP